MKSIALLLLMPLVLMASFITSAANPYITMLAPTGAVNTPSAVTAQNNERWVSLMDVHEPSIRNQLIRRYGDQGLTLFQTVQSLGYVTPVNQTNYSNFQEDWIHETFNVRANVSSPGTGNPINITLAVTNLDASNFYYPRLFDDVRFPDTGITGKIYNIDASSPTAPILTIEPHEQTANFGAVAAGKEIIIYSNGHAPGTRGPRGRIGKVSKFSFGAKIIKEAFETDNTEMTNKIWMDTYDNGKELGAYHIKGMFDAEFRLYAAIDGAALLDVPITNTNLLAGQHRNMTGLIPWITAGGNVSTYTPGLLNIPQLYAMTKKLEKQFAGKEFLMLAGTDFYTEVEMLLTNQFTNNPIVFTAGGTKPVESLDIGFKSFSLNEHRFQFKKMDIFHHPKLYGATGQKMTGLCLVVPNGMTKNMDPNGETRIPYIGFRYKEQKGYSRKMRIWSTGGGNDVVNNSEEDTLKINYLTEMGTEFTCVNKFYKWEEA